MKKKTVLILAIIIMVSIATGFAAFSIKAAQPGLFFNSKESRFMLVDSYGSASESSRVIADKVTGVMYLLYRDNSGNSGMTPLYNNDGSLMIYDEM